MDDCFVRLRSGTRVRYRQIGVINPATSLLVLLHGSNVALECWNELIEQPPRQVSAVAVDLPGHGMTGITAEDDYTVQGMVAFIDSFLTALPVCERYVLCGHSMRGHVAWRHALSRPDRLAGLILLAPGGLRPPAGPQRTRSLLASLPGGGLMLKASRSRKALHLGFQAVMHNKQAISPQMVDRYLAMEAAAGAHRALIARLKAPSHDAAAVARLPDIAVPTLLLWGREDKVFPLFMADSFVNGIPRAELVVLERCGHFPMLEEPQRTAEAMDRFLQTGLNAHRTGSFAGAPRPPLEPTSP